MARSAAEPVIRAAVPGDGAALSAIMRAAYAPYRAAGLDLPPVESGLAEEIAAHEGLVVEIDGVLRGGVIFALGTEQSHVMNLAVDPEASGQGLGQRLMAAVEARARAAGLRRMVLATHEGMDATRAFYARLGWVETGREGVKVYMERRWGG